MEVVHGGFVTLAEYLESAKEMCENTVYYASDAELQAQYVSMLEAKGIQVVNFPQMIDTQYVQMLESVSKNVKFKRVDSDIADALRGEGEAEHSEVLEKLFREAAENDKLTVKCEKLADGTVPAVLTLTEESRRMQDMLKLYAMSGMNMGQEFAPESALLVNMDNPLIQKLAKEEVDHASLLAKQIYSLAVLSQRRLGEEEMKNFLTTSYDVLSKLI